MKKTLTVLLLFLLSFLIIETAGASIKDHEGHWAKEEIDYILQEGLINGYPDNTFKPNNPITRAEVAKVIATETELPSSKATFKDSSDHWASEQIGAVAEEGIVTGYDDDTFKPNDYITRAEVAAVLVRAYDLKGRTSLNFSDVKNDWSYTFIEALVSNNITNGISPSEFGPNLNVTRGEFATFLARVLDESFKPVHKIQLQVTFQDGYTDEVITGSEVVVYDQEGNIVKEDVVNQRNHHVGDFPAGEYTIRSKTPGYNFYRTDKVTIGGNGTGVHLFMLANTYIEGQVTSEPTGAPLQNAEVSIYDSEDNFIWSENTDHNGNYSFALNNGKYTIIVKADGFEKFEKELDNIHENETAVVDVILSEKR